MKPNDNANQAVPSLNDPFKSGADAVDHQGEYNQFCNNAANQLAVFLNFPTVLKTV